VLDDLERATTLKTTQKTSLPKSAASAFIAIGGTQPGCSRDGEAGSRVLGGLLVPRPISFFTRPPALAVSAERSEAKQKTSVSTVKNSKTEGFQKTDMIGNR